MIGGWIEALLYLALFSHIMYYLAVYKMEAVVVALLLVMWGSVESMPLPVVSNTSNLLEHEDDLLEHEDDLLEQKDVSLESCTVRINHDLVEEGSCTYPPPRNNRSRHSCHIQIKVDNGRKYCYNSTEPHAKAAYCDRESHCWCRFDLDFPASHRSCHIYRETEVPIILSTLDHWLIICMLIVTNSGSFDYSVWLMALKKSMACAFYCSFLSFCVSAAKAVFIFWNFWLRSSIQKKFLHNMSFW